MTHTSPDTPPVAGASRRHRLPAALRRPFARHPWLLEVMLFTLALAIYQGSRALVVGAPSLAFENAYGIIDWERSSGLFFETEIQRWVLDHVTLAEALNWFYLYAHWTVTPIFFVWLYRSRRHVYPFVRNAFFAANAMALVVFMVYPVAPPRLVGAGFVDTLKGVSDIDLHGGMFAGWFNPHAAVPSMHFGYAFMIAMVGMVVFRSWPLRLIALAYPVVVFITITGTANHYVLDAAAGSLVIATGFLATWAWRGTRSRIRPGHAVQSSR